MRIAVLGAGAVGARAVRQLASTSAVTSVVVADRDGDRARLVAESMSDEVRVRPQPAGHPWWEDADVAVLAHAGGEHGPMGERLVDEGLSVVSVSADVADVRALLELDEAARQRQCNVVVGAGFSPGLSCLLAAYAASRFDTVDELHVARSGTGGPACAVDHHRARGGDGLEWRDGRWSTASGRGVRQLCWFPEPVGALDCGPTAPVDALVLVPAWPVVQRVTSRMASGRWDPRWTRLVRANRRRGEGQLGAVRVEVRGQLAGLHDSLVVGAVDRPAVAAGSVAALAALSAAGGQLARHGAGGLAELAVPSALLSELARRGVKAAVFEGAESAAAVRESV